MPFHPIYRSLAWCVACGHLMCFNSIFAQGTTSDNGEPYQAGYLTPITEDSSERSEKDLFLAIKKNASKRSSDSSKEVQGRFDAHLSQYSPYFVGPSAFLSLFFTYKSIWFRSSSKEETTGNAPTPSQTDSDLEAPQNK